MGLFLEPVIWIGRLIENRMKHKACRIQNLWSLDAASIQPRESILLGNLYVEIIEGNQFSNVIEER